MRFLLDMNLSPRWLEPLRSAGYQAEHWSDIGSPAATDEQLLA
jgi:predicted nuclease of predicted toxin-antitoxin system